MVCREACNWNDWLTDPTFLFFFLQVKYNCSFKGEEYIGEFSGGLAVRVRRFHCCGPGSFPDPGTEILQATWRSQKKKNKNREY